MMTCLMWLVASPAFAVTPSVQHQTGQETLNANQFWTPERMRRAADFDMGFGRREQPSVNTGIRSSASRVPRHVAPVERPWAVGKLFFLVAGRPASCSGSVIDTWSQRLVLTAGHCVYYAGIWASRMVFVPGYQKGSRPFGSYRARTLWTTGPWVRIGWEYGMNYDMGMVVTRRTYNGKRVGDIVGSLPYQAFPRRSGRSQILGYPAGRMQGERLRACFSTTWAGPRTSGWAPGPTGTAARCNMAAGSSGGPWLSAYNAEGGGIEWVVDGLTSTGNRRNNVISSPHFGSHFRRLIYDAEN